MGRQLKVELEVHGDAVGHLGVPHHEGRPLSSGGLGLPEDVVTPGQVLGLGGLHPAPSVDVGRLWSLYESQLFRPKCRFPLLSCDWLLLLPVGRRLLPGIGWLAGWLLLLYSELAVYV